MSSYNPLHKPPIDFSLTFSQVSDIVSEAWRILRKSKTPVHLFNTSVVYAYWSDVSPVVKDLLRRHTPSDARDWKRYSALVQAMGHVSRDEVEGEETLFSLNQGIRTRTIGSPQDLMVLVWEAANGFSGLEHMSVSNSHSISSEKMMISLTQRNISEFSAQHAIRGYARDRQDCRIRVKRAGHSYFDRASYVPLMTKDYGFSCMVNAILYAMTFRFDGVEDAVGRGIREIEMFDTGLRQESDYGSIEQMMYVMTSIMGLEPFRQESMYSTESWLGLLIFREGHLHFNTMRNAKAPRIKRDLEGLVAKTMGNFRLFVVYHDQHWWVAQLERTSLMYKKLSQDIQTPHKSSALEFKEYITSKTYTFPNKTMEEWQEEWSRNIEDTVQLLLNGEIVLWQGAGGTGKTYGAKEVYRRLVAEHKQVEISAHQAVIVKEVYHEQEWGTLFTHFYSMGPLTDVTNVKSKWIHTDIWIIDEFSTLRNSWLDSIDAYLRIGKQNERLFGGCGMLFIGDALQLPAVIDDAIDEVKDKMDFRIFIHPKIRKHCIEEGNCFVFKAPFRFQKSLPEEERYAFANGMAKLHRGQIDDWFKEKIDACYVGKTIDSLDFEKLSKDPPMFISLTNTRCFDIHQKLAVFYGGQPLLRLHVEDVTFYENMDKKMKQFLHPNILLYKDCPLIVTVNDWKSKLVNGSVVYFQFMDGEDMMVENGGEMHRIQPTYHYSRGHRQPFWFLKPALARTVHNVQGSTFDQVFLVLPPSLEYASGTKKGQLRVEMHHLYVAMSRMTSISGFRYVGCKEWWKGVIVDKWGLGFVQDTHKLLVPSVVWKETLDSKYAKRDLFYNCIQGQIKKYTVHDKRRDKEGQLLDKAYSERDLLTKHSFIFDFETMNGTEKKLVYLACARYYQNWVLVDPKDVCDDVPQNYEYKEDCMIFEYDPSTGVYADQKLGQVVLAILNTIITRSLEEEDKDKRLPPLYLLGFNINGFDMYFLMDEFFNKHKWGHKIVSNIVRTGGNNIKGLHISTIQEDKKVDNTWDQLICKTHDIFQILQGSLAKNCKDWLAPSYGKPTKELEGDFLTCRECFGEVPKGQRERLLQCIQDKPMKGEFPLKLMNRYTDPEEYYHVMFEKETVDLIEEMTVDGRVDWEKGYYKGHIQKAKEHYAEDPSLYHHYPLRRMCIDYCMKDVIATELLYRRVNATVYDWTSTSEQFRSSILRYATGCKLSQQFSTLFYPKQLKKHVGNKIIMDEALYDQVLYKVLRRPPGGKTLPRRTYWKSMDNGIQDYCKYRDISGQYPAAMQQSKFPIGMYSILREEEDKELLKEVTDTLNRGIPWRFPNKKQTTLFLAICITSYHPREMDPDGVKVPLEYGATHIKYTEQDRLRYWNRPIVGAHMNTTLQDIVMAGGKIHHIYALMYWEDEAFTHLELMNHYMDKKQLAEKKNEPSKRQVAKFLGNVKFGDMGKKNYGQSYQYVSKEHISEYQSQLTGDFQVTYYDKLDGRLYNIKNLEFSVSDRPTHGATQVLSYSKHIINKAQAIMYGQDRHDPLVAYQYTPIYGDTDSLVVHERADNRLREYDKTVSLGDKIIFLRGMDDNVKTGKFTDELADAYERDYDTSFPDADTGFCPRIIEFIAMAPKTYGCVYILPPKEWKGKPCTSLYFPQPDQAEWIVKYKSRMKGVPLGSLIWPIPHPDSSVSLEEGERLWNGPEGLQVYQEDGEYTIRCLRFCHHTGWKLHTERSDLIGRHLGHNEEGVTFGLTTDERTRDLFDRPWTDECATRTYKDVRGESLCVPCDFQDIDAWSQQVVDDAIQNGREMYIQYLI